MTHITVNKYDNGDQIRITAALTSGGSAIDPTTLVIATLDPLGVESIKTWSADADVVRDSLGNFHRDVTCTIKGVWQYRVVGDNPAVCAAEGTFRVNPTEFS